MIRNVRAVVLSHTGVVTILRGGIAFMKTHIEYDDFGEYLEGFIDGELVVVEENSAKEVYESYRSWQGYNNYTIYGWDKTFQIGTFSKRIILVGKRIILVG